MSNSNTTTVKAFNLLFMILLSPLFSSAQDSLYIKGEVKNVETTLPLQNAYVYVSCKQICTLSKPDGSFELVVPKKCMTESLIISYYRYKKFIIPVHNIGNGILKVEMKHQAISTSVFSQGYNNLIYHNK